MINLLKSLVLVLSVVLVFGKSHKGREKQKTLRASAQVLTRKRVLWIPHEGSSAQMDDANTVARGGNYNGEKGATLEVKAGIVSKPLSALTEADQLVILCHGTEERPSNFMTNLPATFCSGGADTQTIGRIEGSGSQCKKKYTAEEMADLLIAAGYGESFPDSSKVLDIELLSCGSGGVFPDEATCRPKCAAMNGREKTICGFNCMEFQPIGSTYLESGDTTMPLGQLLSSALATKLKKKCGSVVVGAYSASVNSDDSSGYASTMGYNLDGEFANVAMSGPGSSVEGQTKEFKRKSWMLGKVTTMTSTTWRNPYYHLFSNKCAAA